MQTGLPVTQDAPAASDGLAEAAAAAGYAPSIHDTQPWRWHISGDTLDLHLERSRVLAATDPAARLATLSCGTALHHARTVLAAGGWQVSVARMPEAADQEHLARVRAVSPAPADPTAVRHLQTIPLRRTNRHPVTGAPVGSEDLRAITATVQAEGAWLYVVPSNQVREIAAAAEAAQSSAVGEFAWQTELAYWNGGSPPTTAISVERDRSALFAILHGRSDEPRDWLKAGEALSAAWLTATERGISVLPMGAPVEVNGTRDTMRRLLSYLSHPFLVLRFGTDETGGVDSERAARPPVDQLVTVG